MHILNVYGTLLLHKCGYLCSQQCLIDFAYTSLWSQACAQSVRHSNANLICLYFLLHADDAQNISSQTLATLYSHRMWRVVAVYRAYPTKLSTVTHSTHKVTAKKMHLVSPKLDTIKWNWLKPRTPSSFAGFFFRTKVFVSIIVRVRYNVTFNFICQSYTRIYPT